MKVGIIQLLALLRCFDLLSSYQKINYVKSILENFLITQGSDW
jgi:hypothetical protein